MFSAQMKFYETVHYITHRTLMQEDLYAKICSLSYMGDLRMLFAEDTNKVRENLVLFTFVITCVNITCSDEQISDPLVQSISCLLGEQDCKGAV